MPENEGMFKFHGYSGPCPKPPLRIRTPPPIDPRMQPLIDKALIETGKKFIARGAAFTPEKP